MIKHIFYILFIFLLQFNVVAQNHSDVDDYIKEANKLFEKNDFKAAYPYYQTLRSNNSENADYNFRLGVCMMYSEPDNKTRPIKYFVDAIDLSIEDNRVHYYLGRAYHQNYRFSDAQTSYTNYKNLAKKRNVKSFDIDKRIKECNNGILLLSHIKLLYVIEKQLVRSETFYKSYNFKESFGRVIAVPTVLKTKYDKKHSSPSFGVYLPNDNVLYFASYGDKAEMGLDIYKSELMANGDWSESENLGTQINTPYDDAYPYITKDGSTLYFSSKGHTSIGGYDVFKTTFNVSKLSWNDCKNMNFPTNTPFNDVFYVPDTSGAMAYFSSDRKSISGEIYVYHIGLNYEANEQDFAKAFRDKGDATDIVKLLKDIAELKTNINVDDYKKKIPIKESTEEPEVAANSNEIIQLTDEEDFETIIDSSYSSYRKLNYKIVELQKKKTNFIKIIDESKVLAKQITEKGDEKSIEELKKHQKTVELSTEIVEKLDKKITEMVADANTILAETENIYKYTNSDNKDSVALAFHHINDINKRNEKVADYVMQVTSLQQAMVVAKRSVSKTYHLKGKLLLIEIKDLRQELLMYNEELSKTTDAEERQEYTELIALTESDLDKKKKKNISNVLEYNNLTKEANEEESIITGAKDLIKSYMESSSYIDDSTVTVSEIAMIDSNILVEKHKLDNYYLANDSNEILASNNANGNFEGNSEVKLELNKAENKDGNTTNKNSNANVSLSSDLNNNNNNIELSANKSIADNNNKANSKIELQDNVNKDSILTISNTDNSELIAEASNSKKESDKSTKVANNTKKDNSISNKSNSADGVNKGVGVAVGVGVNTSIARKDSSSDSESSSNIELNEKLIATNTVILESKSDSIEVAIELNNTKINKLKTIAVVEHKNNKEKLDEANEIMASIEKTEENATPEEIIVAKNLYKEVKSFKVATSFAIEKVEEGEGIQVENKNNIEVLEEIKVQNEEYLANNEDKSYETYDKIVIQKIEEVQIEYLEVESNFIFDELSEEKLQAINLEILEELTEIAEGDNDQEMKEDLETLALLDEEKKALVDKKEIHSSQDMVIAHYNELDSVPEVSNSDFAKVVSESVDNSVDKQLDEKIRKLELMQNKAVIIAIIQDSIYIPKFTNESMIAVSSKYLAPAIDKINELSEENKENKQKLSKSVQLAKVNFDISEDVKVDIKNVEEKIENTDNPKEKAELIVSLEDKNKQLVAVQRKAIAGAMYSRLLYEGNKQVDSNIICIKKEFKENRNYITANNILAISMDSYDAVIDSENKKTPLEEYQNEISEEFSIAKENKIELEISKDEILNEKSEIIQKQDKLENELSLEISKKKRENVNIELELLNDSIISIDEEIIAKEIEITNERIVIDKNGNIIKEFNVISTYIERSSLIAVQETSIIAEIDLIRNVSFDDDIFLADATIDKDDKIVSNNDIIDNEYNNDVVKDYYYGNSTDLIYVNDIQVAQAKHMLIIKKKVLIDEEISILEGFKDVKFDKRIAKLKKQRAIIEGGELYLVKYIEGHNSEKEDLSKISDKNIVGDLEKQSTRYLQLSVELLDSSNAIEGSSKQNVISLSEDLRLYSDSMKTTAEELNSLISENEIQRTNVVIMRMYNGTSNQLIRNQAKEFFLIADRNFALAESSNVSSEKIDISEEIQEQFEEQAKQYTELAISNQRKAMKLLKTEAIIANNEKENNAIDKTDIAKESNNTNASKSVNNKNKIEVTAKTTIANIELDKLYLVNTEDLTPKQTTEYKIRKADIVGVYITDKKESKEEFYSESKRIKVNPKNPMGLIYKVQIGAFKKEIPQNTFKGIKPVCAEVISNSAYTRYLAGLFVNYDDANVAKSTIRSVGYRDAFIVAYYNGQRMSVAAARRIIDNGDAYTDTKLASKSNNLSVANYGASVEKQKMAESNAPKNTGLSIANTELYNDDNVSFSVQIGVYGGLRTSSRLFNIQDLFYNRTSKGYYRYFSGTYNNESDAVASRNNIRKIGISDAFIVAFKKGERISITKARTIVATTNTVASNKTVNKVDNSQANNTTTNKQDANIASDKQATNKVGISKSSNAEQAITSNNTLKNNDKTKQNIVKNAKITYKVQIGAFRSVRKGDQLQSLKTLSPNGLDYYTRASGLIIYTSKSFDTYEAAAQERAIIKQNGSSDAFIIAFEGVKRISVSKARNK